MVIDDRGVGKRPCQVRLDIDAADVEPVEASSRIHPLSYAPLVYLLADVVRILLPSARSWQMQKSGAVISCVMCLVAFQTFRMVSV